MPADKSEFDRGQSDQRNEPAGYFQDKKNLL